ncbi:MAG: hypothetical protein L0226_17280 [Acidobacteria bacterium]|nr:hypothetical protein [Acidobacteriota bacterium]
MKKLLKNRFFALVLALGLTSSLAGVALAACAEEVIVVFPDGVGWECYLTGQTNENFCPPDCCCTPRYRCSYQCVEM